MNSNKTVLEKVTPLEQVFKDFKQPNREAEDLNAYDSEIRDAKVKLELKRQFRCLIALHKTNISDISNIVCEIEREWIGAP